MLDDLSHYEYLGNPEYSWDVLTLLAMRDKPWTRADIDNYYYGKLVGGAAIFDGCLPLLIRIGVVFEDGSLALNPDCEQYTRNVKYLKGKIIERVLLTLRDDEVFNEIFCPENLSYDIVYHSIQINNSAFRFKYSNFKNLLINFGFLAPHPDKKIRKLIIHSAYKRFFDKQILPEVKRRKIGIEEFEKSQAQKQIYGEEAEDFILQYEKGRMLKHAKQKMIEKISTYDVSAGYDIISFDSIASLSIDRFIEVKSYSGKPAFYWSRNEMDQARIKKDKYYLYLVNRDEMNKEGYAPLMIQDPYETVYVSPSWNKTPSVTYVTKN